MQACGGPLAHGRRRGRRLRLRRTRPTSPRAAQLARTAASIELRTYAGKARVVLPVPGRHNGRNALAATAAALAARLPLSSVAEGPRGVSAGRRPALGGATRMSGALVIDDTYNANPDSMRAAIDVLAARAGRAWLVMGDMGEVGVQAAGVPRARSAATPRAGHRDGSTRWASSPGRGRRNFGEGALHFAHGRGAGARWCGTKRPPDGRCWSRARAHAHGTGRGRADRPGNRRCALMLVLLAELARSDIARLQRLQLHHVACGAGDHDGAGHFLRRRAADDPLAGA